MTTVYVLTSTHTDSDSTIVHAVATSMDLAQAASPAGALWVDQQHRNWWRAETWTDEHELVYWDIEPKELLSPAPVNCGCPSKAACYGDEAGGVIVGQTVHCEAYGPKEKTP